MVSSVGLELRPMMPILNSREGINICVIFARHSWYIIPVKSATGLNDDVSCSHWRIKNGTQITKPRLNQGDRPGQAIWMLEICFFLYDADGNGEWSCDPKNEDDNRVRLDNRIHTRRIWRGEGEPDRRWNRRRSKQAETAPSHSSAASGFVRMGVMELIKYIKDGSDCHPLHHRIEINLVRMKTKATRDKGEKHNKRGSAARRNRGVSLVTTLVVSGCRRVC